MCGIFGIVAAGEVGLTSSELHSISDTLMLLSESRGKESSGIALVAKDSISVLKCPIPASRLIRDKKYIELFRSKWMSQDPVAFIGHARLVTNGSMEVNANNQPVWKDGIVGVHNGIIVNDEELWKEHQELCRETEVDTEVFFALLRSKINKKNDLGAAVGEVLGNIEGTVSSGLLFDDIDALLLVTNNGSLYAAIGDGVTIFASEKIILETLFKKLSFLKKYSFSISHITAGSASLVSLETGVLNSLNLGKPERSNANTHPPKRKRSIVEIRIDTKVASNRRVPDIDVMSSCRDTYGEYERTHEQIKKLRRCVRCILPETVPFLTFDQNGLCSVCKFYTPVKLHDAEKLEEVFSKYRKSNGEADCAVMFSGGRDSSYGLHLLVKEYDMHPVAYTYDWGMITDLGRRNQARMCGSLGVEHILVSADIRKKRENIRKNVLAWLSKPNLGTVPLFMAGDKQFFYYANRLREAMGVELMIMLTNPHEKTSFKSGFCGIPPRAHTYHLKMNDVAKLAFYYGMQYIKNPSYLNSSLGDTLSGYLSYYFIPHNYLQMYEYAQWDEAVVDDTLLNEYNWETAEDADTTWRIGDGTAPFYNYIYYQVAGFTENDALRSNQIREGVLTRDEALRLADRDNAPRWESMRWYFNTIGVDMESVLKRINEMPKLYDRE